MMKKSRSEEEGMSCHQVGCDERLLNCVHEVLRKCHSTFIEILEPDTFVDRGVENELFSLVSARDIRETIRTSDKNREIIEHVRKRGVPGYRKLKKCLSQSGQEYLLKVLNEKEDPVLSKICEEGCMENMIVSEPSSPQSEHPQSECGSQGFDLSPQFSDMHSISSMSNEASQDRSVNFYLDPEESAQNKRDDNGNMNRGQGDMDRGQRDMDRGPGDMDRGPGDMDRGPGDMDRGPGDMDRGPGDMDSNKAGPSPQKKQKLNTEADYADMPKMQLAKQETDEKVTKTLKVFRKSKKLLSYLNSQQKNLSYFNVVAAEGSSVFYLRIYHKDKFNRIKEGTVYTFHNAIKKYGNKLWVVGSSKVAPSKTMVEIDDNLKIPELPEDAQHRTLEEALNTQEMSTVCGKIVKVSPVKNIERNNETVAIRHVLLKDSSVVKMNLFSDNAQKELNIGDMLKVTPVCKDSTNQQLCGRYAMCKSVPDQPNIAITESDSYDYIDDHDFCDNESMEQWIAISLRTLEDVVIYDCCQVPACKKKKIKDGRCTVCGQSNTAVTTFRATFLYSTRDETDLETTLFQSQLEKILGDIRYNSENDLNEFLLAQLPIEFERKSCSWCDHYTHYRKT